MKTQNFKPLQLKLCYDIYSHYFDITALKLKYRFRVDIMDRLLSPVENTGGPQLLQKLGNLK